MHIHPGKKWVAEYGLCLFLLKPMDSNRCNVKQLIILFHLRLQFTISSEPAGSLSDLLPRLRVQFIVNNCYLRHIYAEGRSFIY